MLLILVIKGYSNVFQVLGTVTIVSVSIMVLTIAFAVAAAWSVVTVIRHRHATIPTFVYWYAAVLSALHLTATGYLLYHGIIGIRTWGAPASFIV